MTGGLLGSPPRLAAVVARRCSRASSRRRGFGAAAMVGLGWVLAGAALAGPVCALQRTLPRAEDRLLREAAAQEAEGDLDGAEATLRELLRRRPGSSPAVFALERVFKTAGRPRDVLPVVDAYLDAEPSADAIWALKVRVVAENGSRAEVEEAVTEWTRANPGSTEPYREGARVLLEHSGVGAATALLEEGLRALGEPPQLLVEMGTVHLAAGRLDRGARAWGRALGRDRAVAGEVFRRVADLGSTREAVAGRLVSDLGAAPATVARLESGAELALREGMVDDAVALAQAALARLRRPEARGFLRGFARKAEDLDRFDGAVWAYRRLGATAENAGEARSADERLAEAALSATDTATALAALARVRDSWPAESRERQEAWTRELEVRVAAEDPAEVAQALGTFRDEYPEADVLDGLSAALASRLLALGQREAAMEVLDGIEGAGAAQERAFLLLEGGAFPEAAEALQTSLPELEPGEATEALELAMALGRLSPGGARLVAAAAVAARRGDPENGTRLLAEGADALPATDQPTALAMGARLADIAETADVAETLRRRIVADHPDSPEFPEAALELARSLAARAGGKSEAVSLLERLIVSHPSSPVAPGARRELRRLR